MKRQRAALPFIALAVAFIAIGLTSNRVFLYLGIVFLAVALGAFARARR